MIALVTGANGMIGSAVVAAAPASVRSLRTHAGPEPPGPCPTAGLEPTVRCDIADADALRAAAEGVDVVIHLAGPPSVARSFAEPAEFARAHVIGTATVVQLCEELAIPRLVHVSSAEVYGRPSRNPVAEGAPTAPSSPYGAAKVGAESVVGAAARRRALDAVVLRPFSIYGPGTRPDSVLGRILDQVLAGDSVRLRRLDGVRDYCAVGDVADAIWSAATTPLDGLLTCNVGSGVGTSAGDLALAALTARHGEVPPGASVEADPVPDGERPLAADIDELVADVRRARDDLGWRATTSLLAGLARTLDWRAGAVVSR